VGFKASEHMSQLDYQFGPSHTRLGTQIQGCTPEPATEAVNRFTNNMAKLAEERGFKVEDPNDLREVSEVFGRMTAEDMDALDQDARELVAELCDGHPTRDEIVSLYHRPFQSWLGWLQGELRDPEVSTGATVRSLPRRNAG
jgi:hypothetical protein